MIERLHRFALVGSVAMLIAVMFGQPSTLATATVLTATVLLAGIALIALQAVRAPAPGAITIGSRARAHRESLAEQAQPSHPTTAGRPLSRAPGAEASAASALTQ